MNVTVSYNSKEDELRMLLDRLFWDPSPGRNLSENTLFQICRELDSEYCLRFNERGYTENYEGFEKEKVKEEVVNRLTDEKLIDFSIRFKDKINAHDSFLGQYYTYSKKEGKLTIGSVWNRIEDDLRDFLERYSGTGDAILKAIYEVNFVHGILYKNYWPVMARASKNGMGKGWRHALSELQLISVIGADSRHIEIKSELRPLVERMLNL